MIPDTTMSPEALSLTLALMDRAEALAHQTFEEQGLPLPAAKMTTVVEGWRPHLTPAPPPCLA